MTNYQTGHDAETRAAEYLRQVGYKIHDMNWKTRFCEIDIVAEKSKIIHFVEVKYRKSARQGSGLDYITPKKLSQMTFAAELWVSQQAWLGDYQLSAIEITGADYEDIRFLADL